MFENLGNRLGAALRKLSGKSKLSSKNIQETVDELKNSLLEADCAHEVVDELCAKLQDKALGIEVGAKLSPEQQFIKFFNKELSDLLGSEQAKLQLQAKPPIVILMAGLQGSGKTTSCAKLANYLQKTLKKKAMLVSCDTSRPGAIEQLRVVAEQVGAEYCPSSAEEEVTAICTRALDTARRAHVDVLIVDTAGRMHIDTDMMQQVKELHSLCKPIETLFVVDGMTGQDAARTTKAFNEQLPITGAILTKMEGDSRGGAALSVKYLSGKPIKFIGTGEKLDALEVFHPERIASRILGMGDMLTLIEEIESKVDKEKAEKLAKKLGKGRGFDLNDLREQLQQMQQMGGLAGMLDKLPNIPGMGAIPKAALQGGAHEQHMRRMVYVIDSMTKKERARPDIISGSRKRRIADGSGTQLQDVNKVLKQHEQMQKMMKKFSGKGMGKMQDMLRGLQGRGF